MIEINFPDSPLDWEEARSWASTTRDEPAVFPGSTDYLVVKALIERDKEHLQRLVLLLREAISQHTRDVWKISPIRRLPDEILESIFEKATPNTSFARPEELTAIRLTCSKWDRIACDHAPLWTNIDSPLGGNTTLSLSISKRLEMWISRSKETKIAVRLSIEWARRLPRAIIADTAHRWQSLVAEDSVATLHLARLLDSSPLIRKVEPSPESSRLSISLPSLRDCLFEGSLPNFSLQAHALTTLELKAVPIISERMTLLGLGAPNIETLILANKVNWIQTSGLAADQFQFPKLVKLSFDVITRGSPMMRNRVVLRVLYRLLKHARHLRTLHVFATISDAEIGDSPLWSGDGLSEWREVFDRVETLRVETRIEPQVTRTRGPMTSERVAEMISCLTGFIARFPNLSQLEFWIDAGWLDPKVRLEFSSSIINIPRQLSYLRIFEIAFVALSVTDLKSMVKDLQVSYNKTSQAGRAGERSASRPCLRLLETQVIGDIKTFNSFHDVAPDVNMVFEPPLEDLTRL